MLRLTFLLCSGLFLLLLLGGRDFGQLRPGLAQAEAETEPLVVTARVPAVETVTLAVVAPVVAPEPSPEPVVVASVAAPVVPAAAVAMVAPVPVPAEPENTVFTLSDFADPAPVAVAPVAAEQAAQGEIWYVAGNSLNVRAGPSTSDEVIGKLTRGEAAAGQILVSQKVNARIEGLVSTQPTEELKLKGFHAPVAAYSVIGPTQTAA